MTAGQSDAERGNAWTRAITPEITAEALGQLRANGLDGWISVFALGYAASEAAQARRFYDFEHAVAEALGMWQADGRTEALVMRIQSALADTAPKKADPEP